MKVLLTGGDGFIGSRLHELYSEIDWLVYDIKRGLDVLDLETLREKARGCDVIVHLAAKIDQAESVRYSAYYYLHNIEGTRNVAKVAFEQRKLLVFASSSAAKDWNVNPYALSKWVGEKLVGMLYDHCILRLFNVYGPGDRPDTVIPTFIKRVKTRHPITIYGNGYQTRDFIHVDDVCRAIAMGLNGEWRDEVGTGLSTTIRQLAAEVMTVVGRQVPVNYRPARQEIRYSVAPVGLPNTKHLEDGIRELAELL